MRATLLSINKQCTFKLANIMRKASFENFGDYEKPLAQATTNAARGAADHRSKAIKQWITESPIGIKASLIRSP